MRKVRWIMIIGALTVAATGCGDNALDPGPGLVTGTGPGAGNQAGPTNNDCGDLPVAPESERVDLYPPSFSNPTHITNPLFPIGALDRVVLLGSSDGLPFRSETTLLSATNTITVDGQEIETLVSQYVAWVGGRIHEVALDWYAQDDQGAVWYLGEDVFNYDEGVIEDTEGTWLAGRDGPVAMIMPSAPQVGDVWRPENICGFVFEEVTAVSTGVTLDGPRGPTTGALIVQELHMDGSLEDKIFAPGYGEFSTGSGSNLEALAVAVPTDALGGPVPGELETLSDGAEKIFSLIQSGRWTYASTEAAKVNSAWDAFRATGVPPMLEAQMNQALDALDAGILSRNRSSAGQASVNVSLAGLDFELQYESRQDIDRDLIEVWSRQLVIDQQAGDRGAVRGDHATIRWIRDRLAK